MTTSKPADSQTGSEEPITQEGVTPEAEATTAADQPGAEQAPEAEATTAELSVEDLRRQLIDAADQVQQYKDVALRAEAEMQNVRRRVARDVENAHKFGIERFLVSLLPTVDSLEKAVEAANQEPETNRAILEGVEICLKMLLDALTRENVVQLNPVGEPFNPEFHEAIQVIESAEVAPNAVAMVIQKGYTLNERLVRPAMVIVARAPAANKAPAADDQKPDTPGKGGK